MHTQAKGYDGLYQVHWIETLLLRGGKDSATKAIKLGRDLLAGER